jgi:GT2 family glycosyltransferase
MNAAVDPPPIRRLDWDGAILRVTTAPHAAFDLTLDGVRYARIGADAHGHARVALPFSPSGHTSLAVGFAGEHGPLGAPVGIALGTPGLALALAPRPLAPLATEELVPLDRLADLARPVAVVVPVYNAPELVRACLDSVLAHTPDDVRLIVIDDASPDAAVAPLVARYASARATVLTNPHNRGFTATANRGIAEAGDADVVLLNADAEVAPHWLADLRAAAYARGDTASATAVSDNAGAFSVPELERENPLPAGWTFHDAARGLRQSAGLAYPRLPTGNGFCLYMKRAAIAAVGVLDEVAFAQGYGEENDWCQRACAHGFTHVIAGNVLVRHARSQSFGHERRAALGEAGARVIRERWPTYDAQVGATLFSPERLALDWRVRRLYAGAPPSPRVLAFDAAVEVENTEVWTLTSVDGEKRLRDPNGAAVDRASDRDAAIAFARWLQRHAFERVAGRVPDDLAAIARAFGVSFA